MGSANLTETRPDSPGDKSAISGHAHASVSAEDSLVTGSNLNLPAPGTALWGLGAKRRGIFMAVACSAYIFAVSLADIWTPVGMTFGIFYLIAISLGTWFGTRLLGVGLSFLSAGLWFYVEVTQTTSSQEIILLWNFISRLGIYLFVVLALSQLRDFQAKLHLLVRQRTSELEAEIAQRISVEKEVSAISHREQQRIGHELHDGLGQFLAGIAFRVKVLEQTLTAKNMPEASEARELTHLISDSIRQTRILARSLDPVDLEHGGVVAAIRQLTTKTAEIFKVSCAFECKQDQPQVETDKAVALYRICQEDLHNAVSHGQCGSIDVVLHVGDPGLFLSVTDDGKGFDPTQKGTGMGLRIMKFRATSISCELAITSKAGKGTSVCVASKRSTPENVT